MILPDRLKNSFFPAFEYFKLAIGEVILRHSHDLLKKLVALLVVEVLGRQLFGRAAQALEDILRESGERWGLDLLDAGHGFECKWCVSWWCVSVSVGGVSVGGVSVYQEAVYQGKDIQVRVLIHFGIVQFSVPLKTIL